MRTRRSERSERRSGRLCPPWAIGRGAVIAASLLLLAGCSKGAPPKPMALEDVPSSLEAAFKDAQPEAKSTAEAVLAAIQAKDEAKAFLELNALVGRDDLTPAQRDVVSRAMATMAQQVQEVAAQGNEQAEQTLETYRARK